MEIFITLFIKLIPLYVLILLGYIGGKYLHVKKEGIAVLLIDIIVPVVLFTGVATTRLTLSTLSLPILFFCICTAVSLLIYFISGFIWRDSTRNILAFISGSANTGYFGLPVAVSLFGSRAIGIVAIILFGTAMYTNSLGYFIAARGHLSAKESLLKLLKLPILFGLILGLLINILGIHLGQIFLDAANNFNGAYIILGMMLIGISIADMTEFKFDYKFTGISLLAKFIFWPLIMLLIFYIDSLTLKLYDKNLYSILLLMAIVPLAVNTVPYATVLKSHPEKVSLAVLISTLIALFYIPIIAVFFLK